MLKILSGDVSITDGLLAMKSCQIEVWREEGDNCLLTEALVVQYIKKHFLNSGANFDIPGHVVNDCNFILKYFPPVLENK